MKKVTLDQIIGSITAEEESKQQAERNVAHIRDQAPKSIDRFERILSEAVNNVNNRLPGDAERISFKMPSKTGTGSLERGRVKYTYRYTEGKLSIEFKYTRGGHGEDFVPKLAQDKPGVNGEQNISILWHHNNECFSAEELAPALLSRFLKDY